MMRRYRDEVKNGGPESAFVRGYRCGAAGLLGGVFTLECVKSFYPWKPGAKESEFGLGMIEAWQDWERQHVIDG